MWSTRCFDDLFRAFVYACCFDLFVGPLWSTHCFDVCFHTLFRLFSTCWVDALFRRPGSMLFFFFDVFIRPVRFCLLTFCSTYVGRRVTSTDVLVVVDVLCRRPISMCCIVVLLRLLDVCGSTSCVDALFRCAVSTCSSDVFFFFSTCVVNVFFNGLYGFVVSVCLLDLCGRRVLSTFCFDVFVRPVWSTVLFV